MANATSSSLLEARFWPSNSGARDIWMIVDCARDPRIFGLLLSSKLEYACLYSGKLPVALENAAPYLLRLEPDDRATHRFLDHAWGHSWGIFLKCSSHIDTLRRHLRNFLTVHDSSGRKLLFRYYDPRVLRPYLPSCTADELQTVFGPITKLWTEGETADTVIEFAFDGTQLYRDESPLEATSIPAQNQSRPSDLLRRSNQSLNIRDHQLSFLEQQEVRKFENWMIGHLYKFFPQQCRSLGDKQLRAFIQYGIRQAAGYGVKSKRDVCKYIDVMLLLGRDFDKDPQNGWAAEILQWRSHASVKTQNLIASAKTHLPKRRYHSA